MSLGEWGNFFQKKKISAKLMTFLKIDCYNMLLHGDLIENESLLIGEY